MTDYQIRRLPARQHHSGHHSGVAAGHHQNRLAADLAVPEWDIKRREPQVTLHQFSRAIFRLSRAIFRPRRRVRRQLERPLDTAMASILTRAL
jgi:hypothetical protein